MKLLVTGGAGFIGSHLVEALVARGHAVRVLDDLSSGTPANLAGLDVELVVGDIRDVDTCVRASEGMDATFHLAALNSIPRSADSPVDTYEVNVTGTWNVLMGARAAGVSRVVYSSSSSVYGDAPHQPKREDQLPSPLSVYAATKSAMEDLARGFGGAFDLPVIGLRYFNIFGPRQDPAGPYAAVVPLFVQAALRGETATIYGDGSQTRDFVYVTNAVEANLAALTAGPAAYGRAFNVATGESVSVVDLHRRIGEAVGVALPPRHAPARAGDVPHSSADITLAREVLGFRPTVALDEGLTRTVAWYRDAR